MADARMKRMLLLGVGQVLFGCLVGLIPPTAVPHFRSIVTAHIEFTANGTLLAVLGLCLPYINLSPLWMILFELNAYVGTISNGSAFLISATTGYGTPLSATVHKLFPFPNGIEGGYADMVTGCLLVCAVTIIIALALAVVGLLSHDPTKKPKAT